MENPQRASAPQRRRKRRRQRKKRILRAVCLLLVTVSLVLAARCVANPEALRETKSRIDSILQHWPAGRGKAVLVVDRGSDTVLLSKREHKRCLPASLAKLFVIEYAATFTELDDVVQVNDAALALTKPESSVAWLEPKEYYLRDLFAAMLVPSGNDAAYAVADYCGGLLDPAAQPGGERVAVFVEHLNQYLRQQGYEDTVIYDPSGFDEESYTTAEDLCTVAGRLLEYDWVREIVGQLWYAAELPDGTTQSWKNTNQFLEPVSDFYNENVVGIKTGSLPGNYHLMVLYQQHGREYLVCSLGAPSDTARYDAVTDILKTIDESAE